MTDPATIFRYKELLGLEGSEFCRVDHNDTMVAEVYKILRPSKRSLILKLCAHEQDYRRELYFLRLLAGSLPVPAVVDTIEPISKSTGAILLECLEGHLLQSEDWSNRLAYEVGSVLARLHLHRTDGYGDLTKPFSLVRKANSYFEEKFNEELHECKSHLPMALIHKCQHYFTSQRHLLDAVDGPCTIHRDFRPGNLIVQEGKLQGIIDWAGARSGFAEQDFCSMVHRQWPNEVEHKKALLDGYSSVRPVPSYQKIMLLLRIGRALAVIGFCVKSNTWEDKNSKVYQYNRHFIENFKFTG